MIDQWVLATQLVDTDDEGREALLSGFSMLVGPELAWALKALYDESESQQPARAALAVRALDLVAVRAGSEEVYAITSWANGLVQLDMGEMEHAITQLDIAAACFRNLGDQENVAATQVSKLYALAVLGRYTEALATGAAAHAAFLELGNLLAAAKIEQNLGNVHFRRERYHEAAALYFQARERAIVLGDSKLLIQVNNGLANVLAQQHRFDEALELYEEALRYAEHNGLELLLATTECNLGCLELFRGRYDRALNYLERSRRRYAAQQMPHETALAEHELADAYLELNLLDEAAMIYGRIIPTYARFGMRAEEARACASYGCVQLLRGELDRAHTLLGDAQKLFQHEENRGGAALVAFYRASLALLEGDYHTAVDAAQEAEVTFAALGVQGRLMLSRWVSAKALIAKGEGRQAHDLLTQILAASERYVVPQVAYRCYTALGQIAFATGDQSEASRHFRQAIAIIEDLRAPLPAEDFRLSFLSDKLTPYIGLVQICLADPAAPDAAEALRLVELARARALADLVYEGALRHARPRDADEARLVAQLEAARAELNWIYNQVNRPSAHEQPRSSEALAGLQEAAHKHEAEVLEITRQLRQRSEADALAFPATEQLRDLTDLQRDLGADTVLLEYFSLAGELIVFVVTDRAIGVVRDLANEETLAGVVEQLRFQIETLQLRSRLFAENMHQLTAHARHHLSRLYDALIRPVEAAIAGKRLVVVPHRSLHYVPFHALYDGQQYLIERHELSIVPSANLLQTRLRDAPGPFRRALLLAVPDERIPLVEQEVAAIAPLFPEATLLVGDEATREGLRRHAPTQDVLHLACHGQFRQDNPLFSSLGLADGWFTVQDAYELDLRCRLVTLSACESGTGTLLPGDELIGLVRGFFAAGARSLLVGLWMVDDQATATLMRAFYSRLMAGEGLAAALRQAQCQLLNEQPHPYFWAAFVLVGGW